MDDRSQGINPLFNGLLDTFKVQKGKIDLEILEEIKDTMIMRFERMLEFPIRRELTFEEACAGIPGLLASITTNTSPGYPLVTLRNRRKGKKDYVWFEDGNLCYTKDFENKVLKRREEMKQGIKCKNIMLGYAKDELVSASKIDKVMTRLFYCNDMISIVAFRMVFGATLIAFNRSFKKTGYAIGVNQYSYDMDEVHKFLTKSFKDERMIDGDFSGFDKRIPKEFIMAAYDIFYSVTINVFSVGLNEFQYIKRHETQPWVKVGNLMFKTYMNFSGCLLTTIINCLCNEMGFRYTFKDRFPFKCFDIFVRVVFLGDDHVLNIHPELEWNPLMIQADFKKINMIYTSAHKGVPLNDQYKNFSDIIFLGAYPVKVGDLWSGMIKISSVENSLLWTRNENLTIVEECVQMLEYLSQHPRETFDKYLRLVSRALSECNLKLPLMVGYQGLRFLVARRTAILEVFTT